MFLKKQKYLIFLSTVLVVLLMVACSTKKNTWATRSYHSMTTRYNVQFNAKNSYTAGIDALKTAHKDDFSRLLPLYPVSNHEAAKSTSSQMDVTIEKCRKAIKLHSIKKKPARKSGQMSDADFRNYYNQEEFNPLINRAWMLLGEAEFQKTDFMGAVGTFSYITRHFSTEHNVVAEANIRMARAYAEMDWLYEAEDILKKADRNIIPPELSGLYSATKADLLLKQRQYKEAIPYLLVANEKEKDKYQKTRFEFVLGQLYAMDNQNAKATQHFLLAKKSAPNYEMQFNAELRAMQSEVNSTKAVKALLKMAKNSNNKDYLDQVYGAVANQYLRNGKEEKGIEYLKKAMAASTRNGIEKAIVAMQLGDLYFDKKDYIDASPCYDTVVAFMPNTHEEFERVNKLADILGELVGYTSTITLQDSLLHLSTLTAAQQLAVAEQLVKTELLRREKAAADSAAAAAMAVATANSLANSPAAMGAPLGVGASGEWYFYNSQLMASGKTEFTRRWGRRSLEDNWRRQQKTGGFISDDDLAANPNDSTVQTADLVTDQLNPAFYLAQIPKTDEDKQAANLLIADALYNLGALYLVQLRNDPEAEATYREFYRRFPLDKRKVETYYYVYQIDGRLQKPAEQDALRSAILTEFPESKYATILSFPDYEQRMVDMLKMQDSLYLATYNAYAKGNFRAVEKAFTLMNTEYPLSELMPKFAFLNAMSLGKSRTKPEMQAALTDLVGKYPDSDVAPMSRDILAFISQGRETQAGAATGSLIDLRNQATTVEIDSIRASAKEFTGKVSEPHALVLLPKTLSNDTINQLLYDVAAFNFSKFLVKDFDLNLRKIDNRTALIVSNMESREEALWYQQMLLSDPLFLGRVTLNVCDRVVISEADLSLIGTSYSWKDYIDYEKKQ